jgi:serine/threonine-protein kinase
MGAVYKVRHTGFDELRAIKVINSDHMRNTAILHRFKQEAFVTRKLQHPNAVHVDDIDETEDGTPFIVMEYIEGRSLGKIIEEQAPLPAARVCSIAKQVAAALQAAHELGIVHRDIKPENIVLVQTPQGEQAKVLDFGIARVRERERSDDMKGVELTGTGVVVGTPLYLSPEQAQGKHGGDLDGRSDLYSLGVVLYKMLTGEAPFKTQNTIELLISHVQKLPTPIRLARQGVQIPDALDALVMRLLQKKRELRPPSAAALIEDLTRVEMTLPASPPGISPKHVETIPAAIRVSVPPPHTPTQLVPRPPHSATPAAPAASTGIHISLGHVLAVAIALVFMVGVWYHTTHRPEDKIADHLSAAADLEGQNLFAQAEQEYRAAAQIDPNNAPSRLGLGHVLIQERKWDEAIVTLREALGLRPDDAVAHNNLGVALQTVGNLPEAITEYHEALRLQPDYLEAHNNLGDALQKQNDLSDSITEYREVLRLKPEDPEAHFHLGLALYKQGNSDGAVDEYREAIRLKPGFALAHFSLGGVLYNRGEHDAGLEELRTAYSLSPDDPEIRAGYQKLLEK